MSRQHDNQCMLDMTGLNIIQIQSGLLSPLYIQQLT